MAVGSPSSPHSIGTTLGSPTSPRSTAPISISETQVPSTPSPSARTPTMLAANPAAAAQGSSDSAPTAVSSVPLISVPDSPSSPKKKKWWANRDSLAKRLFIGRLGSRRRQRHDNNNFVDHPVADPDLIHPYDQHPGYLLPRAPTAFSHPLIIHLHPHLINVSTDQPRRIESRYARFHNAHRGNITPAGPGEANLTRADRKLRQQLRRNGCGREVVKMVEEGLVEFLKGEQVKVEADDEDVVTMVEGVTSSDSEGEWVRVRAESVVEVKAGKKTAVAVIHQKTHEKEQDIILVLDLTDNFARLIVHAMCRYYVLSSESEDSEGRRITYVRKSEAGCSPLPATSFYDYCFS